MERYEILLQKQSRWKLPRFVGGAGVKTVKQCLLETRRNPNDSLRPMVFFRSPPSSVGTF